MDDEMTMTLEELNEYLDRLDNTTCRSGCPTQDHPTYGDCLRAARFGIGRGESAPGQYT